MKTLGIVGGIGPESTIDYYRFILEECRKQAPDLGAPHIVIDSIDVDVAIAMLDRDDRAALAGYVSASVERLARAGAGIALLAANTPHLVFEQVQRQSRVPLISIVQAACDEAGRIGLRRLALLGTGFTMRAGFYPEVFGRAGIDLLTPSDAEQAWLHDKYIHELLRNRFLPETRAGVLAAIDRMAREEGIEAALLAGTELPLLLRGEEPPGLRFLDTTVIHVKRAVAELLA